ncbi:MAG TPA: hypothetical protein ENG09_01715 [Candidatus Syntrophoarchaeum butanivorans]|uniref:Uncharacterized protein n=1 Tax=Candidatus Syntropharchaeum butanivorans TaxID=1839936 RepID=A0A1F2P3Z7_9EURY|nr:MAG: hypothetical protein SBU_001292 [Candidatus Syntrophoarchaeum butanivorans]RJS70960.1 MAG: hypothetical protein CW694_06435 [Candidatus Syntrophoarchaeum sp. WYZ-LMO15]HDM35960.1 hypothetical protein [Candidatus Syntrophoarchaeum butanivorans]HEC57681.1 hypothetical protein [Candidatus Syntrophoarchaeum butanivorans]
MREDEEELYDLLLPYGVPIDIIGEALERFDVIPGYADGDERRPTLRGSLEEVTKAKEYIYRRMKEYIAEMERGGGIRRR